MNDSHRLFERAKEVIPGGVNSPVRAFGAVGGEPRFIREAHGSRLVDVDGSEYIDLVGSWGPLILGHAPPEVVEAVTAAARRGTSFGAPTAAEVELAEMLVERFRSIEQVRLVSSGTEAGLSVLRLARGVTGRPRLVKFVGCYHGHADSLLIQAGSGALTFGVPSSPGVPEEIAALTHLARFNDLDSVEAILTGHAGEVAAVVVEPVAGNMGTVPPAPGFLEGLRQLCDRHGALLIFDEVITGCRVARGGAQERFGVIPDLTMLGKVIGGGLPVGAFGGAAELMAHLAPVGPVYQAGTLSGNPLATAAGKATLECLDRPGVYAELEARGKGLADGLEGALRASGKAGCVQRVGSMMTLFFVEGPVENLDSLAGVSTETYGKFFHAMLARGIALPPSQFETFFVSLAHTDEDVDEVVKAAREVLADL